MEKKRNLWVIPTDKPSRLLVNTENKLVLTSNYYSSSNPQNIYITSDEEIKAGDWFIDDCESDALSILYKCFEIKPFEYIRTEFDKHDFKDCQKIILTTDQDLIKNGVQAIDDEFLEWFVKNPSCEYVEISAYPIGTNGNVIGTDRPYPFVGLISNFKIGYKIIIPKEEQKQYLINMMQDDEKLGLYDDTNNQEWGFETFIETEEETHYLSVQKPLTDVSRMKVDNHPDKQETLKEAKEKFAEAHKKEWDMAYEFGRDMYSFEKGAKWQAERMYSEDEVHKIIESYQNTIENNPIHTSYDQWFEQFKKK